MFRRELEAWSTDPCLIPHATAAAIGASDLVDLAAEPGPDHWKLIADSRVGVAVGDDWEVRVRPRMAVPELLFLLSYVIDPKGWRDDEADFAASEDLFDAVSHGFSLQAIRVLAQGPLRGYVEMEDRLPYVRGRIRFAEQIARAVLPTPLEVSFQEFTVDVPENCILLTATNALLRLPRIPALPRRRLRMIRATLDGVTPLARPAEVVLPEFTRLNERYRASLALAALVLRAHSLQGGHGSVRGATFVFDMNRVFEDFLSVALGEALARRGGEVWRQGGDHLDHEGKVKIKPDIRWVRDGATRAVIDAKYKRLEASGPPNEDVYQMLAYCTAFALPVGYLVYANDPKTVSGDIDIRNAECEVRVRTVDLEAKPDAVLAAVTDLAAEIAGEFALSRA
jgi:5-methylcytosine-specific restriction enzyme subunit McrC